MKKIFLIIVSLISFNTYTTDPGQRQNNSNNNLPLKGIFAFFLQKSADEQLKELSETMHGLHLVMTAAVLQLSEQCKKEDEYKKRLDSLNFKPKQQELTKLHQDLYQLLNELSDIISKETNEPKGEILFKAFLKQAMDHDKIEKKELCAIL